MLEVDLRVKSTGSCLQMQVTMATNYFGTFYLTHMLLDNLAKSAPSRMVITNSLSEMHGHLDFSDLKCDNSHPFQASSCSADT